jgi:hypothetical protein
MKEYLILAWNTIQLGSRLSGLLMSKCPHCIQWQIKPACDEMGHNKGFKNPVQWSYVVVALGNAAKDTSRYGTEGTEMIKDYIKQIADNPFYNG